MKYEWKKTIFTPEDFDGAGQYIVKEPTQKTERPFIADTGYLSTIMQKVGWQHGTRRNNVHSNIYCLIDMSDGLVKEGYFTNTKTESGERIDTEKWIWNTFSGTANHEAKQRLCDYLNNNPYGYTYRFATSEEVVRVVMYQKHRTRG